MTAEQKTQAVWDAIATVLDDTGGVPSAGILIYTWLDDNGTEWVSYQSTATSITDLGLIETVRHQILNDDDEDRR